MSLYNELSKSSRKTFEEEDRWLMGVIGLVADNEDPEKQHRIRIIIPSIDEEMIFDEWARQLVFCLGNGFGSVFLPPVGSEVVLFGQLGQKYNLFYASVYNEDFIVPPDFENGTTAGFRAPGDYKQIAELDMQLRGGRINIESDTTIKITAPGGLIVNGKPV